MRRKAHFYWVSSYVVEQAPHKQNDDRSTRHEGAIFKTQGSVSRPLGAHRFLRLYDTFPLGQWDFFHPLLHVKHHFAGLQLARQKMPTVWINHKIEPSAGSPSRIQVRQPIAYRGRRDDTVAQAVQHQTALWWQDAQGLGSAHELCDSGQAADAGGFDKKRIAAELARNIWVIGGGDAQ